MDDINPESASKELQEPLQKTKSDDVESQGEEGDKKLRRVLSIKDGVSVMVGLVLGSGIFVSTGVVLENVGSVGLNMLTCAVAGLIAYTSSLIYAELGSAMPDAGGDGKFLEMAFGPMGSFVFTWTCFFVLLGGGNAIVALTFARYATVLVFPDFLSSETSNSDFYMGLIGAGGVLFLTAANCISVRYGSKIQNLASVSMAILVIEIIASAIIAVWTKPGIAVENISDPFHGTKWGLLGPGLVAAIWNFDGWNDVVFLSEELKDPKKDLPKVITISMLLVIFIFGVVNAAYFCVLPASVVKSSQVVAVDTVERVFGRWGASLTAFFVAVNSLGCLNACLLCFSRYLYAAAREGQLPKVLGILSPKGAPIGSLIAQGLWTSAILLFVGNALENLFTFYGISAWIFYGASALVLMKLRRDKPTIQRPYEVALYPFSPLLVIGVTLFLIISSAIASPLPAIASLFFVLCAFPVYCLIFGQRGPIKPHELQ